MTQPDAPAYAMDAMNLDACTPGPCQLHDAAQPSCHLELGQLLVVNAPDIHDVADRAPWIEVQCAGGPAFVEATATDFGRSVHRLSTGSPRWMQRVGGVCGIYYTKRTDFDGDTPSETELLSATSCVSDEPGGRDAWGVCPEGTLDGCVARARTVDSDGDRRHALRLALYACRFENLRGCDLGAELLDDLATALNPRFTLCDAGDEAMCRELDERLRAIDPTGQDYGVLAFMACGRGHEPWCESLEFSELCDRDGCG